MEPRIFMHFIRSVIRPPKMNRPHNFLIVAAQIFQCRCVVSPLLPCRQIITGSVWQLKMHRCYANIPFASNNMHAHILDGQ